MDGWVLSGTAAAVLIIAIACVGPHQWNQPSRWKVPDIGAGFFVLVGANSIAEAGKIGHLLVLGHIHMVTGYRAGAPLYASVTGEDWVFFLGGAFAGLVVGLISIRDGVRKIAADQYGDPPPRR